MPNFSPTSAKTPSFVMLAPMEGIIDATLRDLFASIGGIDRCVTEFVRVSQQLLPKRVFHRYCPELNHHCKTQNGTTVYLQLLGDNPELMAANALRACELGAQGIDINYGCPAKTVNNHGGGSVLLKTPERVYQITKAIRQALPDNIAVTAKMRLGYDDKSLALDNASAVAAAGACELAIHARTKKEGYKPPAYWQEIGLISQAINIPVIANGEIWNINDLQQCISDSNTTRIMLGRGLVACPDLALHAKQQSQQALHWGDICLLLLHYFYQLQHCCDARYISSLIKQWLVYLRAQYADAHLFFESIKRIKQASNMEIAIKQALNQQLKIREIKGHIGHLDCRELLFQHLNTSSQNFSQPLKDKKADKMPAV